MQNSNSARTKEQADLRAEFGIVAGNGRGGNRGASTPGDTTAGRGGNRGGGGGGRGPSPGAPNACGPATPAANPALDSLPEPRRREYEARLAAINAKYPQANVQDFVNHIDHAVKLMGIDHVGISSDFDGGGGLEGYNCALEAINVTKELVKRGYTEEQIGKIWSGNLLRVLSEVQAVAKKIQGGAKL